MPIDSDAASAADHEFEVWAGLTRSLPDSPPGDLAPIEAAVVRFHDPRPDLERRAAAWGYELGQGDLGDLARFGAALARAEAEAWRADEPHLATRALEDRRFLVGDRIIHWAVPYLDAVGRCYPDRRQPAYRYRDALLAMGERMRCAPAVVGREGVAAPGEDSFGPLEVSAALGERLLSVWSGLVVFRATLESMHGHRLEGRSFDEDWLDDPSFRRDLTTLYQIAVRRWIRIAESHPGTARLWLDLSERAEKTSAALARSGRLLVSGYGDDGHGHDEDDQTHKGQGPPEPAE